MSTRLNDDDRRAVDMLLDRQTEPGKSGFVASMQPVFTDRLNSVERLLNMLEQIPAAEPPANLVARTLRRVEESDAIHGTTNRAATVATDSSARTHA
jgi:hypothetical protein